MIIIPLCNFQRTILRLQTVGRVHYSAGADLSSSLSSQLRHLHNFHYLASKFSSTRHNSKPRLKRFLNSLLSLPQHSSNMSDKEGAAPPTEHLNIKVTDNNNEVFFKIKRTTQLKKLMDAFCERQGKQMSTVRFLFDGTRVRPEDSPETLDMADGDTLEVHQEQIGGC
ncbi:Ubiquitin-like modifier SUMO, putative [Penicillium digitatum]|uniref:Ubiquitin-like modifier SUMO, putative n=4 Tax=Penicillium TaxID=5073 RepID=K9F9J7_PEND2|nr:Ubiquitin-like modifier SUMO, putative [Penicillium digitatum Pd1]EKV06115.1 Ubiquitin-like modifier SUMO, putative [Penicillium digitatum PHI26]EKV18357.1 Ubiquitin-like modifier SUMO, putative [Penicillium digitatum Pd1]QQK47168.1 Ubiquitin-like modifier SUMO, putative [Penicillium digitatum]